MKSQQIDGLYKEAATAYEEATSTREKADDEKRRTDNERKELAKIQKEMRNYATENDKLVGAIDRRDKRIMAFEDEVKKLGENANKKNKAIQSLEYTVEKGKKNMQLATLHQPDNEDIIKEIATINDKARKATEEAIKHRTRNAELEEKIQELQIECDEINKARNVTVDKHNGMIDKCKTMAASLDKNTRTLHDEIAKKKIRNWKGESKKLRD